MSSQREVFAAGEADAWLERNRAAQERFVPEQDAVMRLLSSHLRAGMTVAEVGCSMGQRTAALAKAASGQGLGLEPSEKAIALGKELHPEVEFSCGTADQLPWTDASVDVLVYGFCLYLCDRPELFRIAAEGDRVLRPGGLLAVLDFVPPFPYRNGYAHKPGVFSYKMDHSALWRWNPAYVEIAREVSDHGRGVGASAYAPDERVGVVVLKKQPQFAYGERPKFD